MAAKSKRDFVGFLRSLFSGNATDAKNASSGDAALPKKESKRSKKSKDESGKPVEFGIEDTERLRHFQRARPPANRRPPRMRNSRGSLMRNGRANPRSVSMVNLPPEGEEEVDGDPVATGSRDEGLHDIPEDGTLPEEAVASGRAQMRDTKDLVTPSGDRCKKALSKSVPNLPSEADDEEPFRKRKRSFWQIFQRRTSRKEPKASKQKGSGSNVSNVEVTDHRSLDDEDGEVLEAPTSQPPQTTEENESIPEPEEIPESEAVPEQDPELETELEPEPELEPEVETFVEKRSHISKRLQRAMSLGPTILPAPPKHRLSEAVVVNRKSMPDTPTSPVAPTRL